MTRNGKIARLPHQVREELNRRLQNGEQGKELAKWLNSLPGVRKVLRKEFGGHPILPQNVSQWKQGGYPDWLARQEALEAVGEMMTEAGELEDEGQITDRLAVWLTARCAITAGKLLRGETEESGAERSLRELCRNVVALRRGDHYARWIAIEQERMEAQRPSPKKLEKQFREWARDPEIQHEFFGKPRMTKEERDAAFLQVLGLWPEEKKPEAPSGTVVRKPAPPVAPRPEEREEKPPTPNASGAEKAD